MSSSQNKPKKKLNLDEKEATVLVVTFSILIIISFLILFQCYSSFKYIRCGNVNLNCNNKIFIISSVILFLGSLVGLICGIYSTIENV